MGPTLQSSHLEVYMWLRTGPSATSPTSLLCPLAKRLSPSSTLQCESHVGPKLLRKTSPSEANREIAKVERERAQISNDIFWVPGCCCAQEQSSSLDFSIARTNEAFACTILMNAVKSWNLNPALCDFKANALSTTQNSFPNRFHWASIFQRPTLSTPVACFKVKNKSNAAMELRTVLVLCKSHPFPIDTHIHDYICVPLGTGGWEMLPWYLVPNHSWSLGLFYSWVVL